MMKKPMILILDDDEAVSQSLKYLFIKKDWESRILLNPFNVLEHIENNPPDVIILDMNFRVGTDGMEGLEYLKKIKENYPDIPVILFTAWGSMQLAIEGMKLGASDFITKPWNNENLIKSIETQMQLQSSETSNTNTKSSAFKQILGESETIQNIKKLILKVAPTDATVLITGESGTGKELIAQAIHELSGRREQPFVKVNLGAIPQDLFESEMFGYKKGAFTSAVMDREGRFSIADKGTLFLDEIGDLPLSSQVKLLRVLQEKTYEPVGDSKSRKTDVRIISATHKPLEDMMQNETFRDDLYYRINILNIHIPPLQERKEDIPILANHFISALNKEMNQNISIEYHTLDWLSKQLFPGNVRQLKNCIERTYLLSDKKVLTNQDFKPHIQSAMSTQWKPKVGEMTLEEMEKSMIIEALDFYEGNITEAAKSLGITRNALYRRIEKYKLDAS